MIRVFTKDNVITFKDADGYRLDTGFLTVTITKTVGDYIKDVAVFNFDNIEGVMVDEEMSCREIQR